MTLEELRAIKLTYTFGYSADTHALRQYQNTEHRICKQVYTPRSKRSGRWGAGRVAYMLTDTRQEFTTLDELLEGINRREASAGKL